MAFLFFISSGLFLGWSLGANDAANIFGTAVGSKMVKFKRAALIASVFVILGAFFQGGGTTHTLSKLGAVDALGGAFTVALCSALPVAAMTYYRLPVSTGQAIVGAIMGWCYFTTSPIDYSVLYTIFGTWVSGPILGAIFSALLYLLLRNFLRHSTIHIIKLDTHIRNALIIAGAFGAYSLGANNIANVMGVFINAAPQITLEVGFLTLNTTQLLFLAGGLSIALGIATYSKRVMETVGGGILSLTPEAAIVVVLAQAIVLFLFSSTSLSNLLISVGLPPIPLVPVSSTQVVVGSVLGIGLIRGAHEVKFKTLGNIAAGWVLTPIIAGIATFFSLFFMQNVFGLTITNMAVKDTPEVVLVDTTETVVRMPLEFNPVVASILTAVALFAAFYIYLKVRRQKKMIEEQQQRWVEQSHYSKIQKELSDIEIKNIEQENIKLASRLEEKKRELITYALSIGEQRSYLEQISHLVEKARVADSDVEKDKLLLETVNLIRQKMSFTNETESIYLQAEQVHNDFPARLSAMFPELTEQEKKLTILLRIGFSSKEIAPILNISPKSVEISRYRLRKKLNLSKDDNLTHFIKSM